MSDQLSKYKLPLAGAGVTSHGPGLHSTAPGSDLRTNHLVTSCMYSVLSPGPGVITRQVLLHHFCLPGLTLNSFSLTLHVHKLLNVDTLFFSSSFSWIQLILTIRSRRILVVYLWPPLLPDPFMSVS